MSVAVEGWRLLKLLHYASPGWHQRTGAVAAAPPGYRGPQQHHHRPQQSLQSLSCTVSEPITIKGPTRQAVSSGRARVQLLLDSILDSRLVDWSHFVSIPLASDEAAAKLQKFQATVRVCALTRGVCVPCCYGHATSRHVPHAAARLSSPLRCCHSQMLPSWALSPLSSSPHSACISLFSC